MHYQIHVGANRTYQSHHEHGYRRSDPGEFETFDANFGAADWSDSVVIRAGEYCWMWHPNMGTTFRHAHIYVARNEGDKPSDFDQGMKSLFCICLPGLDLEGERRFVETLATYNRRIVVNRIRPEAQIIGKFSEMGYLIAVQDGPNRLMKQRLEHIYESFLSIAAYGMHKLWKVDVNKVKP